MKRFLSISIIALALFVGAAGAAPAAHAQRVCQPIDEQNCLDSGGTFSNTDCTCTPAATTAAAAPATPATDAPATPAPDAKDAKPSVDQNKTPAVSADSPQTIAAQQARDSAYNGIMVKIMSLFAWLVGVAAITLDNSVYYTVVTMGNYVSNLSAVGVAWRILRDVGNIMLIFGFLAIGISVILDTDVYGYGKTMLPKLLLAAVFLNFSLFITEAVIDTGNLFATQFYTQINGGTPAGKPVNFDNIVNATSNSVASKIMGQLGLQSIYGAATQSDKSLFDGGNPWYIGFMGIILFLVTAFVLFSLAFILIARFIVLIFVIILAPVGFAGYAIPKLKGLSDQWSGELIKQTITAPILLFLLYVALVVITDANFLTGFGTKPEWLGFVKGSDGVSNFTGFAGMILSFLVAMGLLLSVVIFSKKLGAAGADGATKWAGKLTFGATAWAGRSTVGWGATRAGKYLGRTWVGRVPFAGTGLVKGLDRAGKASFDVRGSKAWGALGSTPLGKIDAGDAQKGGYQAGLKARIKTRTDYAENLITGRELTPEEKKEQASIEAEMQIARKELAKAKTREEILAAQAEIKKLEEKAEDFENKAKTKAAQQRKYANVINLGSKPNSVLNFFNPAANTEAAKVIKEKAKKGKADKDLTAMFKRAVEENASDTGNAGTPTAGGGAAPIGGGGPAPTP